MDEQNDNKVENEAQDEPLQVNDPIQVEDTGDAAATRSMPGDVIEPQVVSLEEADTVTEADQNTENVDVSETGADTETPPEQPVQEQEQNDEAAEEVEETPEETTLEAPAATEAEPEAPDATEDVNVQIEEQHEAPEQPEVELTPISEENQVPPPAISGHDSGSQSTDENGVEDSTDVASPTSVDNSNETQPENPVEPALETQIEPTPEAPVEPAPKAEEHTTPHVEQAPEQTTEQASQPELATLPVQPETVTSNPEPAVQTPDADSVVQNDSSVAVTAAHAAAGAATAGAVSNKPKRSPKKAIKWVLLSLFGLIIVGALSLGGYVYYQYNKPENILLKSVANTFEGIAQTEGNKVSSFTLTGTATFSGQVGDTLPAVDIAGDLNFEERNNELSAVADLGVAKAGVALGMYGQEAYIKAQGLEILATLLASADPQTAALITQLDDQWMSVDESILAQLGISLASDGELTSEQIGEIEQAFRDHRFVELVEQLASEEVGGEDSYHYKARINTEELKAWARELNRINGEALGISDGLISLVDQLAGSIDKADYDMEIWVGKSDTLIRQITTEIRSETLTANVVLNMTDYNGEQVVTPPEQALPLGEVLLNLMPVLNSGVFDPANLIQLPATLQAGPAPAEPQSYQLPEQTSFPSYTLGETDER